MSKNMMMHVMWKRQRLGKPLGRRRELQIGSSLLLLLLDRYYETANEYPRIEG